MAANDESKIHSLIAQWEMEQALGRRITPEELCKDRPELLDDLRKKLGQLQLFPASDETSPFNDKPTERDGIVSTPKALPTIPNYRIEEILGRGGMGVVYKAVQLPLNRTVALKMILSGEHASPDERLRFLAEAESIAKLQHPGIVQIYDFNTHGNHPFFAMEYLTGGSLDKKLNGTPLPPKEAALLVQKLAEAMQAAHEQGIIHRDLKPANILLTSSGSPKISDFGLAKTGGSNLTVTGKPLGTPSYMSPEQAAGKKEVGPATDIYALGAILYECLTGRPPFRAVTPLDTVLQVIREEPVSIRDLQKNMPLDLETICMKCLQKESSKRYQTSAEFSDDLNRFLHGEPIHARPIGTLERTVKWTRRHRTVTISTVSTIAALVIGIGLALWQAHLANVEAKRAIEEKQKVEIALTIQASREGIRYLENGARFEGQLWLAQATFMAQRLPLIEQLSAIRHKAYSLYSRYIAQCSNIFLNHSHFAHACFSPNGKYIASVNYSRIQIYDVINSDLIADHSFSNNLPSYICFSPDSRYVAVVSDKSVFVWEFARRQTSSHGSNPIAHSILHDDVVHSACFNLDSESLITFTKGNVLRVINIINDKPVLSKALHRNELLHASDRVYGNSIFTITQDNTISILNIVTGETYAYKITPPERPIHAAFVPVSIKQACISPNGSQLLVTFTNETALVWDLLHGKPLSSPFILHDTIVNATYKADIPCVITCSRDHSVRAWNILHGRAISPALNHSDEVTDHSLRN